MRRLRLVAALVVLGALPSFAQEATQGWSIIGGKTVGNQQTALEAGFGFPGLHGSLLRGITPTIDIGARFSFDYGIEGLTNQIVPGIKLQGLLHLKFVEAGIVSMMVAFEPGPLFHFYSGRTDILPGGFRIVSDGYTLTGLSLPIRLQLGIAASSALNVGVHLDLPMWLAFANAGQGSASFQFPILMGVGVEYFVKQNLLVYFEIRMGPTVFTNSSTATFTLISNVGIGYRF
jgi:hypothetical protein